MLWIVHLCRVLHSNSSSIPVCVCCLQHCLQCFDAVAWVPVKKLGGGENCIITVTIVMQPTFHILFLLFLSSVKQLLLSVHFWSLYDNPCLSRVSPVITFQHNITTVHCNSSGTSQSKRMEHWQINAIENPTHVTAVGMGNNKPGSSVGLFGYSIK